MKGIYIPLIPLTALSVKDGPIKPVKPDPKNTNVIPVTT